MGRSLRTLEEMKRWEGLDWENLTAQEIAAQTGEEVHNVYRYGARLGRKPKRGKNGPAPVRDWSLADLSGNSTDVSKRYGISRWYANKLQRRYGGGSHGSDGGVIGAREGDLGGVGKIGV